MVRECSGKNVAEPVLKEDKQYRVLTRGFEIIIYKGPYVWFNLLNLVTW